MAILVYSVMLQQNSWEWRIFEGENAFPVFLEMVISKVVSLPLVVSVLCGKEEE